METILNIKHFIVIGILFFLGVLTFLLIKPIFYSIAGGLILAYLFNPLYKMLEAKIKNKNIAAFLITIIAIIIIFVPIGFIAPKLASQATDLFITFHNFEIEPIIEKVMPTISDDLISQMANGFHSFVSAVTIAFKNIIIDLIVRIPALILHVFLIGFVFFFTLRDKEELKKFMIEISPFSERHESFLIRKFKAITDSILYGQFVVGILQGLVAGLGFWLFGIPNALLFTLFAIILGIIPVIGPGLVWTPLLIYVFFTNGIPQALIFFAYNLIIVSSVDNIIKTYVISKRSAVSPIILFVGMIGGLFLFGPFGILLGPLILTYFLMFLNAYREKRLGGLVK